MPKTRKANWQVNRDLKARRDRALERIELRGPGEARTSAAGVTSAALKAVDPDVRALIDAALLAKIGG